MSGHDIHDATTHTDSLLILGDEKENVALSTLRLAAAHSKGVGQPKTAGNFIALANSKQNTNNPMHSKEVGQGQRDIDDYDDDNDNEMKEQNAGKVITLPSYPMFVLMRLW
jgi:hypothetical protein